MTKKLPIWTYLSIFIFFFSSCKTIQQADTIIYNAHIYTVDSKFSQKSAMAIKDGKILATGTDKKIRASFSAKNTQDADKQYIYPGFIDAHCHLLMYATNLNEIALYGAKNIDQIVEKVNLFAKENPEGWLCGFGWDQGDTDGKVNEFPTKAKLDSLYPNRPIYLSRIDGHIALVNQAALNIAGITPQSVGLLQGSEIVNGKLTGILMDNNKDILAKYIPVMSQGIYTKRFMQAQKECFNLGVTSVSEAGVDNWSAHFLDSLQKVNALKVRIYAMLGVYDKQNLREYLPKPHYKTDRLSIRAFKITSDGALGSRGACLLHAYSDKPSQFGNMNLSYAYLDSVIALMSKADYQVCTHAIGDSANRTMLHLYGKYLKGKNDKRWRIEHAQVVNEADFGTFSKFSIIPSVQPTHATSDMYWAEERLGHERLKNAYAYQKLLQQNGWLPLGTDCPVEYLQPLYTFYAAVSRQDGKGFPEKGFQIENGLSREQALKGMTIWAAKSNFEEKEKGSLEKGKFADFVIMKEDLMQEDLLKIRNANVVQTWINGEKVK
jgi:predicted amidohydrolase YtcJ